MKISLTRRAFLKHTTRAGIGLVLLKNSRSLYSYQANEKLNTALIGVAGRGSWFTGIMPKLSNVVAMCDVNDRKATPAFQANPQAKKYHDFRIMLQEMEQKIDAVTIATPDNTHAVISAYAMKMGKHVLCEKPLTHDIYEARQLRQIAHEQKVVTQMGNQGTASHAFRRAVELIQAGVLGQIKETHAWNTGGGAGERPLPDKNMPVPEYINWDLWLGPAKYRAYNSRWMSWHTWRNFATGTLGNWAVHTMNVIFKGLKLDTLWPQEAVVKPGQSGNNLVKIKANVSGYHKHTFPKWEIIQYDFPTRGDMPPLTVNWYNGGGKTPGPRGMIEEKMGRKLDWGDAGEKRWRDHAGCLIIGSEGMIHSNGHNTEYTLYPEKKFKDFKGPDSWLPQSRGHEREWLDACKGGPAAMSNFNYASCHTEFVLLGNVATLFDSEIHYDPIAMKITNYPPADDALKRNYRYGWTL